MHASIAVFMSQIALLCVICARSGFAMGEGTLQEATLSITWYDIFLNLITSFKELNSFVFHIIVVIFLIGESET